MRFRIEENLQRIAAAKGIAPEDASVQLIAALVDAGLLGDKKEDYGEPLSEILFDADPQALYLALYKFYGKEIPDDLFPAFAGCILMGDGDCPICGCWIEDEVLESEVEDPGDYDTPPTYRATLIEHCCHWCGFASTEDLSTPDFDEIEADDRRHNLI